MNDTDSHEGEQAATGMSLNLLAGVTVIDLGNIVAAPFATVHMADFGTEIIKIEHPEQGEGQRRLEPIRDGMPLWW